VSRILIVEDESLVALEIAETVKSFGFDVADICGSSEKALEIARAKRPNTILMDICIKGTMNGIETARELMKEYNPSIIFLTAYPDTDHIKQATELQPVGYLIKPIHSNELFAMLTLAAQRNRQRASGDLCLDSEFSYDTLSGQLYRNSTPVKLTQREAQLLALLIGSKNKIISIYELENEIWPDKAPNENTRRSLLARLRAKLDNRFIETLPAEGYRFNL
jgi:DNA-binding response OmpR family regulator